MDASIFDAARNSTTIGTKNHSGMEQDGRRAEEPSSAVFDFNQDEQSYQSMDRGDIPAFEVSSIKANM